ncbi:TauD/TfdA family dioxygenase [Pseudonocardia nigra]|uniref:TauD/TfdA family dioxygenase n=1 Tax=Pseudonocardia nigra TaxID=1921578 RepID=UPI001C5DF63C|nr:TauD/TfdA family dioxygenase [Pseudonocardia nigra]
MLLELPVRRCTAPTEVLADLAAVGVSLIDEVSGPPALIDLARSIGSVVPHRDSDSDGVTVIQDRGVREAAMAGFTRAALPPHTDRSGVANPPGLLLTACGRQPDIGGEALIVDGRAVHDDLAQVAPDALAALYAPRSVLFGGADGHLGSVFALASGTAVALRLRLDTLVRFAPAVAPHIPALLAA